MHTFQEIVLPGNFKPEFDRVKYSVKYQVLTKGTAMVGVVRQKNKSVGELVEYNIVMGSSSKATQI